ncbi:hypothetical protein ACHAXN_001310 [Cyclotella atomus]
MNPATKPTLAPPSLSPEADSQSPTLSPTIYPSLVPTDAVEPTLSPTGPENDPTTSPTLAPTIYPSLVPTPTSGTDVPTPQDGNTDVPTANPTDSGEGGSDVPTANPNDDSGGGGTESPTLGPTISESGVPTTNPTEQTPEPVPTTKPTEQIESNEPTLIEESAPPSNSPSTLSPTIPNQPSNHYKPSSSPSISSLPSSQSSSVPSNALSSVATESPTIMPSTESPNISISPTISVTSVIETELPTLAPTYVTDAPSDMPSTHSPTTSSQPTNHYKPSSSPSFSASPTPRPTPKPHRTRKPSGRTPSPGKQTTPSPEVQINPGYPGNTPSPHDQKGEGSKTMAPTPTYIKLETTSSPTPFDLDFGDKIGFCVPPGGDKSEELSFEEESINAKECKDDADPWRTCIWRTTSVDKCDRMVKHKPYVDEDAGETLIEGTMTITLSQNRQATSCKNIIQMEKLLLTYLADNVGNDDRFQIACVYTLDSAREGKELSSGETVESTAFKYKLTFIAKDNDNNRLFHKGRRRHDNRLFQRNRALANCSGIDKAMCCSQYAINGDLGEYCSSIGCGPKYCGSGRRKRKRKPDRDERKTAELDQAPVADDTHKFKVFESIKAQQTRPKPIPEPFIGEVKNVNPCVFYGELTGEDWNDSVRTYSEFKPQVSRSLLDVGNVKSVSLCNCNRYSRDTYDVPALSCSEFKRNECMTNEDRIWDGIPDDRTAPVIELPSPDYGSGSEEETEALVIETMEGTEEADYNDAELQSVTRWQPKASTDTSESATSKCSILSTILLISMSLLCS